MSFAGLGLILGGMSSGLQVYVDMAAEALRDGTDLYGQPLPRGAGGLADQGVIVEQLAQKMAADDPVALGYSGVTAQAWREHAASNARAVAAAAAKDRSTAVHLDASGQVVAEGGAAMDSNNQAAADNTAAIAPYTGSPAGDRQMLRELDNRTGTARNLIKASDQRAVMLAQLLRGGPGAAAAMAPAGAGAGMGGGAPASMGGGGGGFSFPNLSGITKAASAFQPASSSATVDAGPAADVSGRDLPPGVANEYKLQRKTILAARAISAAFPEIKSIGGFRADSLKWHPSGLAIDVMIPNPTSPQGIALGQRVLNFVLANQQKFGLDHAIWRQTMHIPGRAPSLMENRGGATANHMDHVHVATSGGGYPSGGEAYAL
ncbi:putative secreted protein [Mycobacteroides abscessus subsp. abscessus]|nr:putative secreted protein [Mycobacteroides abscessus subsp. abscessus]